MKQGELRRALLVATLLCIFLVIYLYWQQASTTPVTSPKALFYDYKHSSTHKRSQPPQWTWECINQRCERRHSKSDVPAVSQTTCSMLCGSTQLWPQPTGPVTLSSKAVVLDPNRITFQTNARNRAKDLAQEAFEEFLHNVMRMVPRKHKPGLGLIVKLNITHSDIVKLKLDTDESYRLLVKVQDYEVVANISASNFFAARHGLETLSQLIWWDDYEEALKTLKGASVQDSPAFKIRGLMLDTSRNFMSVQSLKKTLRAMAANKLNLFHWHVSDSQSFPLVLPRVPELAKYGAYSDEMTYSPEEVKEVVRYGRVRGIRVLIEIDTPAHAGNGWTFGPEMGLGELAVCVNERPWSLYCGEPPCGQLNPDNPKVYEVLEKIYRDLLELTEENEFFHIGGDEVNLDCWIQHLQKSSFAYNFTDLHDLWGDFTLKALAKLKSANNGSKVPNVIVWSSQLSKRPYLNKYLDNKEVVVQSWGSSHWSETTDLLSDGYRVILSHVNSWYLDCGFGRWRETGDAACDPYRPWQTFYTHRPWEQYQASYRKLILGGVACLWSEQFDENSLDSRVWPRTAAFAERLWTDPLDSSSVIQEDVYTRMSTHRDRMVKRGFNPEAMWPVWCAQNPGMCL